MRLSFIVALVASLVPYVSVAADTAEVPTERKMWRSANELVETVSKSSDCELRVTGWQRIRISDDSRFYVVVVSASNGDRGCTEALELVKERSKTLGIGLTVEKKRPLKPSGVPMSYDLIHEVI